MSKSESKTFFFQISDGESSQHSCSSLESSAAQAFEVKVEDVNIQSRNEVECYKYPLL